ncbi:MAG: hypothetical protein CVT86_05605 [Alphaproteobacteria bacterium HGW-Alphaproteobacteria-8]|nr:MAG: hypothetical protein CVT86_05605 [Alphaproteobacteria bacterium HGW-Alphaproteobacteria-8]
MTAITGQSHATSPQALPHTLCVAAFAALAQTGRVLGDWMRAVQVARMMQALSAMSDRQLAQIGVLRADIPAHARAMVLRAQ